MTLYVLVGIPGAGKSTWVNQQKNVAVVCPDAIREELYGDAAIQGDGAKVFALAYQRANHALASGYDVVFDATNVSVRARKQVQQNVHADRYVAVFINTPTDVCKQRNTQRARHVPQEVIDKMAQRLTTPTKSEGFSEVIVIQ